MQPHRFTEEELKLTLQKYPKLKQESDGVLKGEIDLNHQFGDVPIVDTFQISIEVDDKYPESFPRLTEIGGRTKSIAEKHNITDYRDLHCNSVEESGTACVCAPLEERRKFPKGGDICVYIDELAIPYLYGLSHFEKYRTWPWGEWSHDYGPIEAYATIEKVTAEDVLETLFWIRKNVNWIECHKQLKKPNPRKRCLCQSGKPFCRCHKDVYNSLKKLSEDAKEMGLNVKGLLDVIANRLNNQ